MGNFNLWNHDDRQAKVVQVLARYWHPESKGYRDLFHAARRIRGELGRQRVYTAASDLLTDPPDDGALARRVMLKAIRAP